MSGSSNGNVDKKAYVTKGNEMVNAMIEQPHHPFQKSLPKDIKMSELFEATKFRTKFLKKLWQALITTA